MANVDNREYKDDEIKRIFTYGMLTLDPERHQFDFKNETLAAVPGLRKYGFRSINRCFYIKKARNYRVIGSTYDATPELLKRLDAWEDSSYTREPVTTEAGELAWAYIGTNLERIESL